MPSPFPGMNPYLERAGVWEEFHNLFLAELHGRLGPLVRPRYRVHLGERVVLRDVTDDAGRGVKPDLSVAVRPRSPAGGTAVVTPSPASGRVPLTDADEVSEWYLEVLDLAGREVVTVLELLSPSNKYAGDDARAYRRKRTRFLRRGVNFVEIDLLRGGPRTIPELAPTDYVVVVARAATAPDAGLWPFRLRDPIPPIPIPLRPGEPEPMLDVQPALHAVYDRALYADEIYDDPPDPALAPEDAAWAATLIPTRESRP